MEHSESLHKLEALLFGTGEPVSRASLGKALGVAPQELQNLAEELAKTYTGGVRILSTDTHLALVTTPALSEFLESELGDRKETPIGDAGLEVLALLLYEGAQTKSRIDHIRGVNSSSSLRLLLSRGLIVRQRGAANEMLYSLSPETLMHLGIGSVEEAPRRAEILSELRSFVARIEEEQEDHDHT